MYTLIRNLPFQQLLLNQLPALLISFLIAERFYKFHSFTLECAAFLVTWFVCDLILSFLLKNFLPKADLRRPETGL